MPAMTIAAALALCLVLSPIAAHANIVKLEITKVEPAGPTHERITGKAHGELDPADPKNAVITDIELAPRNARGKVEYVTTFSLVRPTGTMTFSGVLVYTVVNRGGGNALPHPAGHVTLVSGWQGDVVPTTTNYTIEVPVAKNRDGSSITGPLLLQFMNLTGHTARLVIPRGRPSPYPPVSLDTTKATLISATGQTATGAKKGRGEDSEHRLGICGLLDDAVSRKTRSREYLREERFRSCASLRAAVHGERSARTRHWPGGDERSRRVLPVRNRGRGRHAEPRRGTDHACDLRRKLAVGHVPANIAAARLQSGRARAHRVGRDEPPHRCAIYRSESALRFSWRARISIRARS